MYVISTIPPYAPYIEEVAAHPNISGVRLNTMMPIRETIPEQLGRLKGLIGKKDLWLDLKYRQIRTTYGNFFNPPAKPPKAIELNGETVILDPSNPRAYGELRTPPWAEIGLSHPIQLDLSHGPIQCFMQDGYDSAYIAELGADGKSLIMLDGPKRVMGGGESINILDPSFKVLGTFTNRDLEYIEAGKSAGIHTYMISYVEVDEDITGLLELDPKAKIVAKIESQKGIEWVKRSYRKFRAQVRLMAARGDLYVEVGRPDRILPALRTIAEHDPTAILASRILTSLRNDPRPLCSEITDIDSMLRMGYKHFMVGDDVCFDQNILMLALDILSAIGEEYDRATSREASLSRAIHSI